MVSLNSLSNCRHLLDQVEDFVCQTYSVSVSTLTASRLLQKTEYTWKTWMRVHTMYEAERGLRFLKDLRPRYE